MDALSQGLSSLFVLGRSVYVYMDQSDNHTDYFLNNRIEYSLDTAARGEAFIDPRRRNGFFGYINEFAIGGNIVPSHFSGILKIVFKNYKALSIFSSRIYKE